MNKEIYFGEEGREKLFIGINKLADAVGSTLGPKGKTVIISDIYGRPYVTKDGVSVAKAIELKDPVENLGAQLLKEVAEKTANEAGDGTTTSIVLAASFINNLKEFDIVDINKAFDEIIPKVLEGLKKNSRSLNREDVHHVASISANNDTVIGEVIQEAYNFSDIVKVEEGNSQIDVLELVSGMRLDVSYMSKHFITNPKRGECLLDNPNVIIIDGKIDHLKNLEIPIQHVAAEDKPLLIIAEAVSEPMLRLLETNVLSKNLKVCVIKSPGFGQHRKDLLRDIADFTGATLIQDTSRPASLKVLGILKSCSILKNSSTLVKDSSVDICDIVEALKELMNSKDILPQDKDLLQARYENLSGKIAVIRVGGGSELEMKERKDRYDDAVLASACALEEGIVEGGGVTFQRILFSDEFYVSTLDIKCLEDAILISLLKPLDTIRNSGVVIDSNVPQGMFGQNVIDPLKVTRCALQNAVSIARIILSTSTVVLNERQWT